MGYNTIYELEVLGSDKSCKCHEYNISKHCGIVFREPIKWYNHRSFMIEYSKEFPGAAFAVTGRGEDRDDYWRVYFKDGKCSDYKKAVISFAPFNESELVIE